MKDKRLVAIRREDTLETVAYALLVVLFVLFFLGALFDKDPLTGQMLMLIIAVAMGGIRIRMELRKARAYWIRRENTERAERAGLSMPRLYEETDDLQEALQKLQATPQSATNPSKHTGPVRTTVCPNCAHCMAIPPDYARSEAKCGSCGHVYKL